MSEESGVPAGRGTGRKDFVRRRRGMDVTTTAFCHLLAI